jgi:hypothetical protein
MNSVLQKKFNVRRNLTFAFIDSWAKHPLHLDDEFQQAAFEREAAVLWNAASATEEFLFKSVEDILVRKMLLLKILSCFFKAYNLVVYCAIYVVPWFTNLFEVGLKLDPGIEVKPLDENVGASFRPLRTNSGLPDGIFLSQKIHFG